MVLLKTGGFVTSQKGPGGGYLLAIPPEQITLTAVLRSIEGPLAPLSCVSVSRFEECGCPSPETCPLRKAFKNVRDAMVLAMDRTSFADLASKPVGNI
jgi:Rrf2 family protein